MKNFILIFAVTLFISCNNVEIIQTVQTDYIQGGVLSVDTVFTKNNTFYSFAYASDMGFDFNNDSFVVICKYELIDGFRLNTGANEIYQNSISGTYEYIDSVKCIEYNLAKEALREYNEKMELLKRLDKKKCE